MKPTSSGTVLGLLLALCVLWAGPARAFAQNPDDLMPAESAAKAKAVLQQSIDAMGGPAYLHARTLDCKGTIAQFESSGAIGGYVQARVLRDLPDKTRTEMDTTVPITDIYGIPVNKKGRHIVVLYNGDGGWVLGGDGVSDLASEQIDAYQEQLKTDLNMILRYRLSEDGLVLRYGGSDIVDVKQVDWVEVTDREHHDLRAAIDRKTHLPVRVEVTVRDPETGERSQTARVFSNYHPIDGVQTPFQTSSFRKDQKISQVFYDSCQYTANLPPDTFTRAGLDANWAETRKGRR